MPRARASSTAFAREARAFAAAWQRHTGTKPMFHERLRLYRLGTLMPPEPLPEGRSRVASERDRQQLMSWYREFVADMGEVPSADTGSWANTRIACGRVTFWESPDGTLVSMAGVTLTVAGQIRVAPVYTPAHLRGRGYAGAATAEVSRAALAAGVSEADAVEWGVDGERPDRHRHGQVSRRWILNDAPCLR